MAWDGQKQKQKITADTWKKLPVKQQNQFNHKGMFSLAQGVYLTTSDKLTGIRWDKSHPVIQPEAIISNDI